MPLNTSKSTDPARISIGSSGWMQAAVSGVQRFDAARAGKLFDYRPGSRDQGGLQIDILGAAGEIALAQYLGVREFTPTVNSFKGPDITLANGVAVQVRTRRLPTYDLIVRPRDVAGQRFALVTLSSADSRELIAWGWLWTSEGQRDEFWKDPDGSGNPAWFIEKGGLRGIGTLGDFHV